MGRKETVEVVKQAFSNSHLATAKKEFNAERAENAKVAEKKKDDTKVK